MTETRFTAQSLLPWIYAAACLAMFMIGLGAVRTAAAHEPNVAVVRIPDAAIDRFEGTWLGQSNATPFGPLPFPMDFRRQEDGSLRSRSVQSRDTWVDLHFKKDESGIWLLHEGAKLAGFGEQHYTMHPVGERGDTLSFAYLRNPAFLNCEMAIKGDQLYMRVNVHGKEHVRFLLDKQEGEASAALRREMKANEHRDGSGDIQEFGALGTAGDPVEIGNARARTRISPDDVDAHLGLANALTREIDSAPPQKLPAYAQEMLSSYRMAVALDPGRADARYGLAQYYLNAPPIAGGSVEAAAAEADALAKLESPLAELVRAQIEAKQGDFDAAAERLQRLLEEHPEVDVARHHYLKYVMKASKTP